MDIRRAEEIIAFAKSLTAYERNILFELLRHKESRTVEKKEMTKKKYHKKKYKGIARGGKSNRKCTYTDEQIRDAWELKQQGVKGKEIARLTGIKVGSTARTYLKKRLDTMVEQIPKSERIRTY